MNGTYLRAAAGRVRDGESDNSANVSLRGRVGGGGRYRNGQRARRLPGRAEVRQVQSGSVSGSVRVRLNLAVTCCAVFDGWSISR